MENITGILLCGGRSIRMGNDKASKYFANKPMVLYPLNVLKQNCNEIIISANDNNLNYLGYKIIPDIYQHLGPIGGLHACLKYTSNEYNLLLACDMPLISGNFLKKMLQCKNRKDAIVPLLNGMPEPLYSIYNARILSKIKVLIELKTYSLQKLLLNLDVEYIEVGNENRIEFSNANTPDELNKIEQIARIQLK